MNLQGLGKVEVPDEYLDIAFRRAKKATARQRALVKGDKLKKSRAMELVRLAAAKDNLIALLERIINSFPQFDELDPFYQELVKATLDYVHLKKSLGAVTWAIRKVRFFYRHYHAKIRNADLVWINIHRRAFFGRVSSVVKQIKKELAYLEEVRKILKDFPQIKTKLPTVVIAGSPNVGKTTLLAALTGSTPQIASYPFTTKKIMIGYTTINKRKMQFLDTPGLLDREMTKRNKIELKSILALKYLAKVIFFVYDPSERCGYPMKQQKKLLLQIKKMFKLPIILVVNKADLEHEPVKGALEIVAKENKGIQDVRKSLAEQI